ncbi:hypothetical protein EST38_g12049 [Candolleomyces aberdarensis]|uniref:Uncharacterized protein n=1 Tax=Candolleomyces aberdarensis TaxID=2316362 RepID=A0A4V1Q245_9AGAR|nr:hypothetical protein EST38_g12049 [Candolleomyces aberdarensis]
MRARATQAARDFIDASRNALHNIMAKVATPSASPASHATSRFSGSQASGQSSLKSQIIRGISRLFSPRGSPIIAEDVEANVIQAQATTSANAGAYPEEAILDIDISSAPASPLSPTVEEWLHQRKATVEDVEDEDDDFDGSNGGGDGGDWGFEGWDTGAVGREDEWTPEDYMREEFERSVADLEGILADDDIALLRAFALKVEDNLSDATFDKFRYAFPESDLGTYKTAKARIQLLAGFKPVKYDCCPNSCMVRYNSQKQAHKHFTYIPLIPRLQAYFQNPKLKEEMQYRHKFETMDRPPGEEGTIEDVFDSENYKSLKGTFVNVDGKQHTHTFFSDPRDIALGISTDGFCPFKRRKQTCWPIILFNYNLPPDIRFAVRRILCVGVIPGPKKPKDSDSFLDVDGHADEGP